MPHEDAAAKAHECFCAAKKPVGTNRCSMSDVFRA
jgi:hypothetical protein